MDSPTYVDISYLLKRYQITKPTFYAVFRNDESFPKPLMVGRLPRYKLSDIEEFEKSR